MKITVDDRVAAFLLAGAEEYRRYFPKNADFSHALQLHVDCIVSEYIVQRLSTLIPHEQLKGLVKDPDKLYAFATDYLKNRFFEFEEGEPADASWTP